MIHHQSAPPRTTSSRSGVTLVETVVTAVLLGIVFVTSLPVLTWIARMQRENLRRTTAILEASNLVEALTMRPWNDLPPGDLAGVALPPEVVRDFPELSVTARVEDSANVPESRRVTVELSWNDTAQRRSRPVRLSGWVSRPEVTP